MCSCRGVRLSFVNVVPGETERVKARRSANEFASADLSHLKNLRGFAWFERWALEFRPESPFARFVAAVKAAKDFLTDDDIAALKANPIDLVVCAHTTPEVRATLTTQTVTAQVPSDEDIEDYAKYVLYGREACELYIKQPAAFEARQASGQPFVAVRKSRTVLNYIYSVQAIYKHFGVDTRLVSGPLFKQLSNMSDDTHAARSFHVDKELKKIYDTVCGLRYWNETKKLMYWTMTLVTAASVCEPCDARRRTDTDTHWQTDRSAHA